MKRRKLSRWEVVQGLLLMVALAVLLSFAGTSDMESQRAVMQEVSLYRAVK